MRCASSQAETARAQPGSTAGTAWLEAHRTYPEDARRRGEEGRVTVRFTVDRTGKVLDAEVAQGSGSVALDTAALDLLRQAALPPFAPAMAAQRVTITIQLHYTLMP